MLPYSIFFQSKSLYSHPYQMVQNFWQLHMNQLRIWYDFANLLQNYYKKIYDNPKISARYLVRIRRNHCLKS